MNHKLACVLWVKYRETSDMNEIRARNILVDHYNKKFFAIVHKLTGPITGTPCYSNNLACHPAAGDMRSALKLKLHNAINSAILAESEDRGIFVGGRRRNRKKKKTKNGRDVKEKKKNKKNDGKDSPNMKVKCHKNSHQKEEDDKKPLIEVGYCDSIVSIPEAEEFDDLPPLINRGLSAESLIEEEELEDLPPLVECGVPIESLVQYSYAFPNIKDYVEKSNNYTMSFFKRKSSSKSDSEKLTEMKQKEEVTNESKETTKSENSDDKQADEQEQTTAESAPETKTSPAVDAVKETKEEEGTSASLQQGGNHINETMEQQPEKEANDEKKVLVENGISVKDETEIDGVVIDTQKPVVTEQPNGQQKTKESSPLITKDEDVGCLCCTIL